MKLGLLVSGELGYETVLILLEKIKPVFIATDKSSSQIIQLASSQNIRLFIGNPRNGRLKEYIGSEYFDIIISINYLFLIEQDIIDSSELIFNLHGSLLPKYRGRTPHVWAIINNENKTGVTAHAIDEKCDTGDILIQKIIKIDQVDTGADILNKFKLIYPEICLDLINRVQSGEKIAMYPQDHKLATYYGKRTPDDGKINWEWQKERIYNWVRALADPYPGAFTIMNSQKIIIDKVSYLDYGFHYQDPNGKILSVDPDVVVKTPNGAIKLERIRGNYIGFNKGDILK